MHGTNSALHEVQHDKHTSHQVMPKAQHAGDVFPQGCIKAWQLRRPLIVPMYRALGRRLRQTGSKQSSGCDERTKP